MGSGYTELAILKKQENLKYKCIGFSKVLRALSVRL